jgi:hypothetical protein
VKENMETIIITTKLEDGVLFEMVLYFYSLTAYYSKFVKRNQILVNK